MSAVQKPKVYVTDSEFPDIEYERAVIEEAGGELIGLQCRTEEDLIAQCGDAVGLINQYAPVSRRVLAALPHLQAVSRMGIGVNSVDVDAATELGIYVSNVPDASVEEVSNHALALLMACARKITVFNDYVKGEGQWNIRAAVPIARLSTQTLGLLSFGQIARKLAEKSVALGLKIMVYDPYVSADTASQYGVRLASLEEVLQSSDYVSVHTPLTKETQHLIGEKELKNMKPGAFLINTGRGAVVDEAALVMALREGWIAGAALDVLEQEPVADNPLRGMKNVIITPHAAWYSEEALVEIRTKTARGVAEVLRGGPPTYLVNKGVQPRLQ